MKSLSEIAGLSDLNDHPVFSPQNFDLVTLGDPVLQRKLIESFLRQHAATRGNLISAGRKGSKEFDQALHQLKGICHFTAAERVLHILRSVAATELVQDEGDRVQVVEVIIDGLEQLETALRAFLSAL